MMSPRLSPACSRRAARRDAADQQPPVHRLRVEAEPGPPGPGHAALGEQIAEDRSEQIDRHEHVAGARLVVAVGVADDQRTDADQLALAVDQRGPAPGRMRRAREDRALDQILPASGELAAAGDADRQHHAGAAVAHHQRRVLLLEVRRAAEGKRLDLRRLERAQAGRSRSRGRSRRRSPARCGRRW